MERRGEERLDKTEPPGQNFLFVSDAVPIPSVQPSTSRQVVELTNDAFGLGLSPHLLLFFQLAARSTCCNSHHICSMYQHASGLLHYIIISTTKLITNRIPGKQR